MRNNSLDRLFKNREINNYREEMDILAKILQRKIEAFENLNKAVSNFFLTNELECIRLDI